MSACKPKFVKSLKTKIPEIPPFRGHVAIEFMQKSSRGFQSTSTVQSDRIVSQPVRISEIPPFRKHENQHSNYPTPHQSNNQNLTLFSISLPKDSDISPFKIQRNKDLLQAEQHSQDGSHPEHQLTIGPSGGAEWTRRLKVAEQSPIHRSTDCIVSGTSSDSELLKPAPSWSNVALKTAEQPGTSASAPSVPKAASEEEQRAAEVAAKKSRLKQKLVKSARSVAIFSLKLKERRAREAERIAKEKAEDLAQEIAMSAPGMCGGGGELNLIPLEQLIHIEDVVRRSSNTQNTYSSGN